MAHPLDEQGPIGQPSNRIMERLVLELLLECLPLTHIAAVQDDAAHVLVVQQIGVETSNWRTLPSR